ncbi:hypothetical protein QMO12_29175 [Klebsiella pneumoniae]|uniref:hypothetical protein n=1 Tax=Klebsiella pneumoniae TaxID=573 RepID=UPI002B250219|nr:hypothetical protein [Klebsiella pneumoniae]MEB2373279.1 hypothetical protein [Klebsiella pneumoniae]
MANMALSSPVWRCIGVTKRIALWPEEYARMTREVEEALREADDPNAKSYTHEEVMQAMQERIDRARDKAMLIG